MYPQYRNGASFVGVLLLLVSILGWSLATFNYEDRRQNGGGVRKRYKCPEGYRRVANWCYLFSQDKLSWREAQFACKDREGGQLAVLNKRAKDRYLKRNMIRHDPKEREEVWLGGIYDSGQKGWIWGSTGERFRYQAFSRRRPNDNYTWRCVVLDPILRYRWNTRSCIEQKNYICEAPIKIVQVSTRDQTTAKNKITRKKVTKERKNRRREEEIEKRKQQHQIETNEII